MRSLIILNDAPYGSEKCYNALRLAQALLAQDDSEVQLFLWADAVTAARQGQKTPEGYYNVERMLTRVMALKGSVMVCGTCMEARGLRPDDMVAGATTSNVTELADLIAAADRVLTF